MPKKFDVVIGNPPYQDDLIGDNETKAPPIYDKFMDAAFELANQVVLITPARFLSNAGQTPKAWNAKVLSDPHLRVAIFERDSSAIFPGTDIKGGIVVTHRNASAQIGPIGHMAHMQQMESTVAAVQRQTQDTLSSVITEHPCKWSAAVFREHPELEGRIPHKSGSRLKTNTFTRMSEVCFLTKPTDGQQYIHVLGLLGRDRALRWIRRDLLVAPAVTDKFKVVVAAANGSGAFGETLTNPVIMGPHVGLTQTFIAIGAFDDKETAEACLKYVKTKFTRALLSVLFDASMRIASVLPLCENVTFERDGHSASTISF